MAHFATETCKISRIDRNHPAPLEVWQQIVDCFQAGFPGGLYKAEDEAKLRQLYLDPAVLAEQLNQRDRTWLVACNAGIAAITGLMCIDHETGGGKRPGQHHMEWVIIRPEYRRQGIACLLARRAIQLVVEERLADSKEATITASVEDGNAASHALARSMGLVELVEGDRWRAIEELELNFPAGRHYVHEVSATNPQSGQLVA